MLGRSLDELPPQTRRLLELLMVMVGESVKREGVPQGEVRFTRRQVREWTQWGQTQLKLHLDRLEEHEYVLVHRFGRSARLHQYELLFTGRGIGGSARLSGIEYDDASSGVEAPSSGSHRAIVAPLSGQDRGSPDERNSDQQAAPASNARNGAKHALPVLAEAPTRAAS